MSVGRGFCIPLILPAPSTLTTAPLPPPPPAARQELLGKHEALQALNVEFDLSSAKLRHVAVALVREMFEGLDSGTANVKMLPSFVTKRPLSGRSGSFLALDLGGTNLRVMHVQLKDGKIVNRAELGDPSRVRRAKIPREHRNGTGQGLFDFIAVNVKLFAEQEKLLQDGGDRVLPLGFTFSFPIQQTALDAGSLVNWTKGFSASGVVGQDIVRLLTEALQRQGLADRIQVRALCNDTVGTLVARYFEDPRTESGLILGTGSNACYWEHHIPKLAGRRRGDPEMIINMEWGNFDSPKDSSGAPLPPRVLPVTVFDDLIDRGSNNWGQQRFEKMVSGMYIWDLVRLILNDLAQQGIFFRGRPKELFRGPWRSGYPFQPVLTDQSRLLSPTGRVLQEFLLAQGVSEEDSLFTLADREIARFVCRLVVRRAARLAAAGVHAILTKSNSDPGAVVAVDGGVFEHTPGFKELMLEALEELDPRSKVQLQLQKDGSGIGAALIAAWSSDAEQDNVALKVDMD